MGASRCVTNSHGASTTMMQTKPTSWRQWIEQACEVLCDLIDRAREESLEREVENAELEFSADLMYAGDQ